MNLAFDGLSLLSEKAESFDLNVIVENHGGLSSNGLWLSELMAKISKNNCVTLPDFGNFYEYDKYKGVAELMPWAKSVSAKTFDFDEAGQETTIDYKRMIKTVTDAGFNAWLGVEYEGDKYSEVAGIQMTIDLLKTFQ